MKNRRQEHPATAKDRAAWARERRAMVGSIISQPDFVGALVMEHVRGSQYLLRMPDGAEVFASHTKPKYKTSAGVAITDQGWRLWENRR
jgi:hypothetical protein